MTERRTLLTAFHAHYQTVPRGQRSAILDEFVRVTGYNRHYAARALKKHRPSKKEKIPRPARVVYDAPVCEALEKIWINLDYVCGKRLVAAIPAMIEKLTIHNEINIARIVKRKLQSISPATADRLLAKARARRGRKKDYKKNPNSYLFAQVPIKTFGEWKDAKPGFLQMDLVAHNGGDIKSGHLWTLNVTDVATGWTIGIPVARKTEFSLLKAIYRVSRRLPFPVLGLHSDNGSEFINKAVVAFAQKHEIQFTRGRPYKKNDACFIEQKNNSTVRRNAGWFRYDNTQRATLERLFERLSFYTNFFQPSMKLMSKTRKGAKTYRKYDTPQTPYHRALAHPELPAQTKRLLKSIYADLNPAALRREIDAIQEELIRSIQPRPRKKLNKVRERNAKTVYHKEPARRRLHDPSYANPFMEKLKEYSYRADLEKVWRLREKKNA